LAEPEVWKRCLSQFKREVSTRDYEQFIRPLRAMNTGGQLILVAQNDYVSKEVNKKHLKRICDLVAQFSDPGSVINEVEVRTAARNFANQPIRSDGSNGKSKNVLKEEYTFERFVEGSSNQYSKKISQQVAKYPGSKFNPLLIFGSTGLGKTHLMQSIGNYVREQDPTRAIVYMNAQNFVSEMVMALTKDNATRRVRQFTKQFRRAQLLLIDDIHLFADKDKCQEEFFHVFNHLIDSDNVQIVLTSDRYPHEIEGLDARLRSRFVMGFTTEVKNSDLETRAAILVQKSREVAVDLDLDVALYIARNVKSNVRELIGALKRVIFNAEYHGHVQITIQHVQDILKDLFAVHRRMISIEKIQNIVAEHFHIRLSDILGTSRLRTFVRPRHIAMALAHELTDFPLQTIAGHFNRDHSTVMNAIERIAALRESNPQIEEDYDVITRKLIN